MSTIVIDHLTRDYGNNKGIFDVSLTLDEGEVFGFLGPNGAGKTTTIRHLLGFLKPQLGTCHINKLDCWTKRDLIQKQLGYIPGEINFFSDMTGKAYLDFLIHYKKLGANHRTQALVDRFDLDTSTKIKKMSKGTKQKLGIVAAFMHDPHILILDEPTSGLDPLMQNIFVQLLLEEKARGKTILMSSHIFEEVDRTCEKIGIIRDGKLITIDSVHNLRASQTQRYQVTLRNSDATTSFLQAFPHSHVIFGSCVEVLVSGPLNEFLKKLASYDIISLSSSGFSLENIFKSYYGGHKHD